MRRTTAIIAATFLALAIAGPASAHGGGHGAGKGFLPPKAKVHGYTLTQLATAWNDWAFRTPAADNPLEAVRCEQSSLDKKIWFLPVSLGGDDEVPCEVPAGAFLVATPAGYFCDVVEAGGSSTEALRACVDTGFDLLSFAEVILDGRQAKHLDRYVVTTDRIELPGPNYLTATPNSIVDKGIFVVIKPLHKGTHTIRLYDEFDAFGFTAGITFNVTVGKAHHHH